jgi:hypothetical protein
MGYRFHLQSIPKLRNAHAHRSATSQEMQSTAQRQTQGTSSLVFGREDDVVVLLDVFETTPFAFRDPLNAYKCHESKT